MTNSYHKNCGIRNILLPFVLLCTLVQTSCDTESIDFGSMDNIESIVADEDQIVTASAQFEAKSRTEILGAVRGGGHNCYLGRVSDPVTGITVKAEYICQLHCFEGQNFPMMDSLAYEGENGDTLRVSDISQVKCDSTELIIYFNSWYGDSDAPLKVSVQTLRQDKILENDSVFYTDVDLQNYVSNDMVATKVITAWDNTLSDSELNSDTHTHCARIKLPESIGTQIMRQYYTSPEDFKDTYTFLRKVCPGFYVHLDDGDDAMLAVSSTSLNVYYLYAAEDSVVNAYTNFVGSAEVVQATNFVTENPASLLDKKDTTYVSSPAGLYTEIELPIDEIYENHESDSLARVQITMMRYNSNPDNKYDAEQVFSAPTTLAMIPKSELTAFFERGYELQARKFATASLSETYNTYDFSNISRLVSYLHDQRDKGDADWNRVVLVPVSIETNTSSGTITLIRHDLSITAAGLVGRDTPLTVSVTYSRYK